MKNSHSTDTLESMSQAVWYNQWTLSKFKKYLNGKILEVGCGIGNFTKTLVNFGQVYAIDINADHIRKTAKFVRGKGEVGFGDIEKGKYFFEDEHFDVIVCLNVLEHIQDDTRALRNLYKLLKSDGTLILLVPSHPLLYGQIDYAIGHFKRYTKDELGSRLKELDFQIILSKTINFLGAVGWYVVGKIFRANTIGESSIKLFNSVAPLLLPIENLIEPPIGTSILIIAKREE